ncbi:MAG: hypothetical protein HWD90_08740 [Campylobacteraceae bacterium]|nr:hypothetical protein [Campylobacteraceae bacterium]
MIVEPASQSNYYFTNNDSKKETTPENSIFQEELSNTQSKEDPEPLKEEKSLRELVEDIISLLKTGFTKEELEAIEKLKEEILAKIKEEQKNGTGDIKTIERLLDKLEKMIDEFKKSVNGVNIKEAEDIEENKHNLGDNEDVISPLKEAILKIEELSAEITEITKLKKEDNRHINNQEELLLLQALKNS